MDKSKSSAKTPHKGHSPLIKWLHQCRRRLDHLTAQVTKHSKRFVVERWDHIRMARRPVVVWLGLMLVLICGGLLQTIWYNNQLTTQAATTGGTYAEGVVDKLTTVSPLYATTDTEKAASQLVYPGLLAYDDANKLNGDLATSWSQDETAKVWTVKLRDNLTWSDGQPLTADDVVYTVQLMKNNDINGSLANSWSTITATAKDRQTVEFTLSSPLATFDSALTFGILPKHILDGKSALEVADLFSSSPDQVVGAGPFTLGDIEQKPTSSIWHFTPSQRYYGDPVRLDELVIHTYADDTALANGLKRGEVNAISNVKVDDISQFNLNQFKIIQLKTAGGVYALFNYSGELTGQATIRNALRLGLNRTVIRESITKSNANLHAPNELNSPIATGIYDSVDQIKQPDYNQQAAREMLDRAGWTLADGAKYRTKDGQTLTINIATIASTNYEAVAKAIAGQWQNLGVDAKVESVNAAQAQQNYLAPRNYDVLVYQIQLGGDPDVFAYWSSTQANQTGLNLANYNSRRAEIALTSARANANPATREARYIDFTNQWLKDSPAIALYQPSLFYVMDKNVDTLQSGDSLISAANRFQNVSSWTVDTKQVMTTP